jgi:DNA polymerase III epsilon subunit-like protein
MPSFIFDLETTGLDIGNDKITEIALLNVETNRLLTKLVNPQRPLSEGAMKVTGKSFMDYEKEKPFSYVADEIIDFIGTDSPVYIIGHNVDNFDKPFLEKELRLVKKKIPKPWKFIDTLKIAREILPELESHSQESLRKFFNVSETNSHAAAKDVMDLQLIFQNFTMEYSLPKLHHISKCYNRWPCFEYRGRLIRDVPLWYLKKMKQQEFFEKNPDVLCMLKRSCHPELSLI